MTAPEETKIGALVDEGQTQNPDARVRGRRGEWWERDEWEERLPGLHFIGLGGH